ncbi:inositol monophosphatase family protein [Neoaquamicrobium sediminum]|uniref:inositol monophosphatase family protein n=1 Tax=Neoaquamicrobium sediminum TaxID=1849104 RepID=UPI001563E563|nr:inositol monophosphatase [Mesorhizobium sediminum]NRC55979.1 inositol monophosphatase [Mesorhizobium sediminum]
MQDNEVAARLERAQAVAREAGGMAMSYFARRDELAIETKANPQDVFSVADRNVETRIREMVVDAFSADGFLGEEFGMSDGSSGFTWVVDPIDGTSPFIFGLPTWCVSISLLHEGRTVAGVIYAPPTDEMFACMKGAGATLNGRQMKLDAETTLSTGLTGLGANFRVPRETILNFVDGLMAIGGVFIRNGSGALMLAHVAAGRLVAYYEPHMNSWDCLAGMLMVREAGGWAGEFPDGDSLLHGGPVLVASPGAKDQLQELVAATTTPAQPAPATHINHS